MLAEFDIIRRCLDQPGLSAGMNDIVRQGIGDDCALIDIPAGKHLAFSMDTLVAGVHFPENAAPADIARRALAVNLSDLAATGAKPLVFTLAMTLPVADDDWLFAFADGLKDMARAYHCSLIGGDISRGPLVITIQVHGLVDPARAILRHGANPGDLIYITGTLGRAGLALSLFGDNPPVVTEVVRTALLDAYYRPEPRLNLAMELAEYVSAGIDISDGLLGDLQHICESSGCGAVVRTAAVPVDERVGMEMDKSEALALALNAGDDYELILTVPPEQEKAFLAAAGQLPETLTCIGEISSGQNVICLDEKGEPVDIKPHSYTHFAEQD